MFSRFRKWLGLDQEEQPSDVEANAAFGLMKGYEDVKEFLENLGIEYRFSCFYDKNHEGCQYLGDWFDNIQRDFPTALKVYKMNCDNNNFPRSCYKVGWYRFHGKGEQPVDYKVSCDYFEKACQLGSAVGCLRAGQFRSGTDPKFINEVEPKPQLAIEYLKKGCDGNNAKACQLAHQYLLNGIQGVQKDEAESAKWAEKGCALMDLACCHNLYLMYHKGVGVEQNDLIARHWKVKAMDLRTQMAGLDGVELQEGAD